MADISKLMLSEEELKIVKDTHWILTKQGVLQKVHQLFGEQVPAISSLFLKSEISFPDSILSSVPKISRGENYKGLPYVILDYPSVFGKEHVFALRTMFWWGHFFSVSLQLSGVYQELFSESISKRLALLPEPFFICVHEDPWQHHFESTNYVAFGQLKKSAADRLIYGQDFIKIALKFELDEWNQMDDLLQAAYKTIIHLIKD
jgi:hypothetical protein